MLERILVITLGLIALVAMVLWSIFQPSKSDLRTGRLITTIFVRERHSVDVSTTVVDTDEEYVYAGFGGDMRLGNQSELYVMDITQSATEPPMLGRLPLDGIIVRIKAHENTLYVLAIPRINEASPKTLLHIINITDPTAPQMLTSFPLNAEPNEKFNRIEIYNDTAYISGRDNLQIIDVTDPANPQSLGRIVGEAGIGQNGLAIDDNYAYVGTGGLIRLVDITEPTAPYFIETEHDFNTRDIVLQDGIAYTVNGDGLEIIDLNDPLNPQVLSFADTPGDAWEIKVSNGYAYVSDGTFGLTIFDVRDPANPSWEGYFAKQFLGVNLAVVDQYIYAAGGANYPFRVFEFSRWEPATE